MTKPLDTEMREYLEETILGGNGIARVTAYLHDPRKGADSGFVALVGELISPYILNSEASYTRFSDRTYANNQYLFRRGSAATVNVLLLADGSSELLLADGVTTLELGA